MPSRRPALLSMVSRVVACLATGVVASIVPLAHAQETWPAKPVRIVVPYPPGGASDITARMLAQKLTETWNQQVVVDNRPGANGIVALEHVAKQPPDGYTLLFANLGPNAINPAVYAKLPYDPVKDFTPITLTTVVPQVIVAAPGFEAKTLKQMLDYARANPGKVNYGTGGNGSANHLGVELMAGLAGVQLTAVAYKGDAPAMTDTMAGVVQLSMPTVPAALPQIKAGKLVPLAVGSKTRVAALPDVPTIAEAGVPGYESVSWGGLMGPGGMAPALVNRINADVVKALRSPDLADKLGSTGAVIVAEGPQEFAAFLAAEIRKWDGVAKKAGIKVD